MRRFAIHVLCFVALALPAAPALAQDVADIEDVDEAIEVLGAEEGSAWTGSLEFGATYTSGNTDRLVFSNIGQVVRETVNEKLEAKLSVLYGEDDGLRSVSEQILTLRGEWKVSPWYFFLQVSAERDEFEQIDWRVIIAPGAGYWFVNDNVTKLKAEAGPAYTYEDFRKPRLPLGVNLSDLSVDPDPARPPGTGPGGDRGKALDDLNDRKADFQEKEGKLQARVSVFASQKVFDNATITEEIEYYPELGEPNSFRLVSITTFEQPLSEAWFFKLQVIDQYNTPVQKDIKRNDFKAIMSLVFKF